MCHVIGRGEQRTSNVVQEWSTVTRIITDMCADVRGKVITWRRLFDTCLPISWQWKVAQAPKLAGRLHVPRVTLHTTYKVKRSRSPGHSGWLFKWLAGGGDIFWRPHNLFEHLLVSSWVYIRLNVKYFDIFFSYFTSWAEASTGIFTHKPNSPFLGYYIFSKVFAFLSNMKFSENFWMMFQIFVHWWHDEHDTFLLPAHTRVNVDLRAIKQVFVSTAHQWLRHCMSSAFFTFTNIFHFASIIM